MRQTNNADDKDSLDTWYGWGTCAPGALQVLNNVKAALAFLCCAIFAQAMLVNGFARSVVTTLERRFGLSSTDLGSVLVANDVANLLAAIPIGYLCAKNKPRWLGCGMVVMALGAFIFALPQFVADPRQMLVIEGDGFCVNKTVENQTSSDTAGCTSQSSDGVPSLTGYKYVLILGKFLIGTGACTLFSLGVTYINENSLATQTSIYLGIFYAFSIVGPGVGYLLSSAFLNIPGDLDYSTDLSPDSPQWVGAWWVGFLLSGAMAALSAVFLFGFPRKLPLPSKENANSTNAADAHCTKNDHGNENPAVATVTTSSSPSRSQTTATPPTTTSPESVNDRRQHLQFLKDFWQRFVSLMKNPALILLSLATVTEKGMVSGIVTFTPKYVESQFRTTAAEASFIVGLVTVPAATVGTLLGGYLVKRLQLDIRGIAKFCLVVTSLTVMASLAFLITCSDVTFAGITTVRNNSSVVGTQDTLTSTCNAACHCSRDAYSPVCGSDDVVYFSPCHAGCDMLTAANGSQVYEGCQCTSHNISKSARVGTAVPGKCSTDCPLKPLFYGLLFFMSMGCFITLIPLLTGTLRSVTTEEGPFATGIQEVFVRGLGYIPCILLVGGIIDYACVLWDTSCQNAGSCLLYRNRALSINMVSVCVAYKTASCLIYLLVLLFNNEAKAEGSTNGTV
ncbi:sodium-independent organic anion transmembrane transporter [Branchiostoma belcheri]|nr:sodium-independent organic anion transmembrane transporter [Branchiostoma belcheri]